MPNQSKLSEDEIKVMYERVEFIKPNRTSKGKNIIVRASEDQKLLAQLMAEERSMDVSKLIMSLLDRERVNKDLLKEIQRDPK